MGHTYDSQRRNASKFPEHWSHQDIVNAVRDTIEEPDYSVPPRNNSSRIVYKEVDGELIYAKYSFDNHGILRSGTLEAYPATELKKGVRRLD